MNTELLKQDNHRKKIDLMTTSDDLPTNKVMAGLIGIDPGNWSKILHGKQEPGKKQLELIAKFFGRKLEDYQ